MSCTRGSPPAWILGTSRGIWVLEGIPVGAVCTVHMACLLDSVRTSLSVHFESTQWAAMLLGEVHWPLPNIGVADPM